MAPRVKQPVLGLDHLILLARLDPLGAVLARLQVREGVGHGSAAARRVPDAADAVLCAATSAGHGHRPRWKIRIQ